MDETLLGMLNTASFAIAVFCAVFCLTQPRYRGVSRSFALFLAAVALNDLAEIVRRLFATQPELQIEHLLAPVEFTSALSIAPFFWIYVFRLTSADQRPPPGLSRHLILPALGLITGALTVFLPPEALSSTETEIAPDLSPQQVAIVLFLVFLEVASVVQLIIYLFLILRRLLRYRLRLQDFYASTERHELRWIYLIGTLGLLFWVAQFFDYWRLLVPEHALFSGTALSGLGFALLIVAAFWGLRQRPALVPAADGDASGGSDAPRAEKPREKYEKSALSPEASERIERKLRAAMARDHLYRDPNLSLWTLAGHVGASPNYISQTLNEVIGESFFDFVNRHRIAEAKRLLSDSGETVLAIAYEAGFNSRSSFYTAFKRVTGRTPSEYRNSMSFPDGPDDQRSGARDA